MLLHGERFFSINSILFFFQQAWFNFLAHNQMLDEEKFPHFQQQATPNGLPGLFPLHKHLSADNEKLMATVAKQLVVNYKNNRVPVPKPTTIMARRAVPTPRISAPAPPTLSASGVRVLLPGIPVSRARNLDCECAVQAVLCPLALHWGFKNIFLRSLLFKTGILPGRGGQTGRVTPVSGMVTARNTLPPNQQPVKKLVVTRPGVPYVSSESPKCQECQAVVNTDYDRHMHRMHKSKDTWFCRQCGTSKKTEMELFLHYMEEHLKPAYMKFG